MIYKKKHILIIEDDEDIQQLVSFNLVKSGFNVTCANSAEEGLTFLEKEGAGRSRSYAVDGILLDVMLPGINGIELCKILREKPDFSHLPILMMTARREDEEIIKGLDNGADDYITKPFSPKVLIARLKSVIRRSQKENSNKQSHEQEIIEINNLEINHGRHEVKVSGQEIQLTKTEFAILSLLAKRPGWVFSRQQIIDSIRGNDYIVTPRMIDVQVFSLRKKLRDTGNIETVRGIGYRYKAS